MKELGVAQRHFEKVCLGAYGARRGFLETNLVPQDVRSATHVNEARGDELGMLLRAGGYYAATRGTETLVERVLSSCVD
jgi:hypothetical protein